MSKQCEKTTEVAVKLRVLALFSFHVSRHEGVTQSATILAPAIVHNLMTNKFNPKVGSISDNGEEIVPDYFIDKNK